MPRKGQVWRRFPEINSHLQAHSSISSFLTSVLNGGVQDLISSCLYLFWGIWKARNEVIFHHKKININKIIDEAWRLRDKYGTSCHSHQQPTNSQPNQQLNQSWSPPSLHNWKINADGAFLDNKMAGAAVLRDHEGAFKGSISRSIQGGSPLEAEGLGISLALELCRGLGIERVTIEGDCKGLMDSLRNKEADILWRVRQVIEEGRAALEIGMVTSFNYVPRNANRVAHSLATHVLLNDQSDNKWSLDEPPSCIMDHLSADRSNYHTINVKILYTNTETCTLKGLISPQFLDNHLRAEHNTLDYIYTPPIIKKEIYNDP